MLSYMLTLGKHILISLVSELRIGIEEKIPFLLLLMHISFLLRKERVVWSLQGMSCQESCFVDFCR